MTISMSQAMEKHLRHQGSVGKIWVGELILSKAGNALMSVITDKRKVDGFEQLVEETLIKTDYKIAKILSN